MNMSMQDLSAVIKLDIENTIVAYEKDYAIPTVQIKLDSNDENRLAQKILLIPHEYLIVLFMKHYFGFDNSEVSEITEKQNIDGHLHYINELLCLAMGLPEGSYMHQETIKNATCTAMTLYMADIKENSTNITPKYTRKFKQTLKMIPAARKSQNLFVIVGKRVAVLVLVILLTFTTTIAVNAELRARFFEWVRNILPEYTEFGAPNSQNVTDESILAELWSLRPHYIPDGFSLIGEPFLSPTTVIRSYANDAGDRIDFRASIPTGSLTAYDTEGAVIEEIQFLGNPAFIWENKGFTYFIWQHDGFEFSIMANLTITDTISIAESVNISK